MYGTCICIYKLFNMLQQNVALNYTNITLSATNNTPHITSFINSAVKLSLHA